MYVHQKIKLIITLFLLTFSSHSFSQSLTSLSNLPSEKKMKFNCAVKNDDGGCLQEVRCPTGYAASDTRIACNLEGRKNLLGDITQIPFGQMSVVRESDNLSDGRCELKKVAAISSQSAKITLNKNPAYSDFEVYCTEKDGQSGADCSISGEVLCKKYNGPIFENQLKFRTFRPVQGIAKLGSGNWLATQDFNKSELKTLRFSLLGPWGDVIRDWDMPYKGHGQSLYIRASALSGYDIFTEASSEMTGIAQFHIDANLEKLSFVKEIPLNHNDKPYSFTVFSVHEASNKIVFFQKDEAGKYIKFANLDQALNGTVTNPSIFNVKGALGSLQGIALSKDRVFVLFGDAYIYDQNDKSKFLTKSIMRYSFDGKIAEKYVITEGRNHAINEGIRYEPEGIHLINDALYFNILTDKTNRFYRAPANFIPVPN